MSELCLKSTEEEPQRGTCIQRVTMVMDKMSDFVICVDFEGSGVCVEISMGRSGSMRIFLMYFYTWWYKQLSSQR